MQRREFFRLLASAAAFFPLPLTVFSLSPARAQNPGNANQSASGQPGRTDKPGQVGQVATVEGVATVTRGNATTAVPVQAGDAVFKNDTLATGAASSLGITFDDETTFSLSANSRIVVNEFVYREGGSDNTATFTVAVGTAAFVASLVAKTGDMKIATPIATLGIRGTTGVVEVPEGAGSAAGGAGEPRIKLYPDADGHVGRIEVFNPQGERLGALTQGGSAFSIQRGPGGSFRAVPLRIPPSETARDRGVLQRLLVSHNIGRRMTIERRRSRGGGRPGPNNPRQPGRGQPFNRNPRPGGPPRGQPRRGGPNERRRG